MRLDVFSFLRKSWLGLCLMLPAAGSFATEPPQQTQTLGGLVAVVVAPRTSTAHPPLLVLMHGFGSDENDLLDLLPALPPQLMIVSLRAPLAAMQGYSWYDSAEANGQRQAVPSSIAASRGKVETAIKQLLIRQPIDRRHIYVGGFSQGASMSYELALHDPALIRGALVMSGDVFDDLRQYLAGQPPLRGAWGKPALVIGHGTADDRIPYAHAQQAMALLQSHGIQPLFLRQQDMGHSVSSLEVTDMAHWLQQQLAIH